jgi:ATP synthase protein I
VTAVHDHDREVLLGAGIPTVVVGVVAVVVGAVAAGAKGALGAALALVVVLVFFGAGQLVVGRAFRTSPQTAMNAALLVYVVDLLLLLVLVVLLKNATAVDSKVFGLTVVACTIAWTLFQFRALTRLRILYVDPEHPRGGPPDRTT